ncbi:hypothetical protein [Streptomyces sp. NPDC127108]|uniref:hypothetical protein n=1 Tax=Streptomyces sp. NPDC127108 TaxID=3345361 RepID=UPI003641206E
MVDRSDDRALTRAIPLPAICERRSVTVTYPSHPVVDALFESLGGALDGLLADLREPPWDCGA